MEKNLTSGSVLKTVIYFSLPYLLSYFLQTLYGMADLFIIGQFGGVDGTTAVSVGSQVMHMLTVMMLVWRWAQQFSSDARSARVTGSLRRAASVTRFPYLQVCPFF